MEYRDLIQDEIERLGKALALLFSKFSKSIKLNKPDFAIEELQIQLNEQFHIDIEHLKTFSKDELKEYLDQQNFKPELYEDLANLLSLLAKYKEDKNILVQIINLLDLTDEFSGTASFERITKKHFFKNLLSNLK